MSGFPSKDIRTIVLQSADPSLLFFISLLHGYFLKEFHSLCVMKVSQSYKRFFYEFELFEPGIFLRPKENRPQTRYHLTLIYINPDMNRQSLLHGLQRKVV